MLKDRRNLWSLKERHILSDLIEFMKWFMVCLHYRLKTFEFDNSGHNRGNSLKLPTGPQLVLFLCEGCLCMEQS